MLVCSLAKKSRKRSARDEMYTSATDARCVHDVADLVNTVALRAVFTRCPDVALNKLAMNRPTNCCDCISYCMSFVSIGFVIH